MGSRSLAPALLAAALLVAGGPASGEECEDLAATPSSAEDAKGVLADLATDKCLGNGARTCLLQKLCDRVADLVATQDDEELVNKFRSLPEPLMAELTPLGPEGETLRTEIRRQFESFLRLGDAGVARSRFQPKGLKFFANDAAEVDLARILDESCPDRCAEGFRRAMRFYTVASLYRRSLGKLLEKERAETLKFIDGLEKRWQAYFADAHSQYPWELALNSSRYQRSPVLAEPPTRQLILAHPSVAFEIVEQDGEEVLEEALVLEVFGVHTWRFEGDRLRRPFGASLVVSWHGGAGDDTGYGVLFHLPRSWSLGVTYRDDDFSALFNADLGKLFTNGRGLYEKVFE